MTPAELLALADAATPGPWQARPESKSGSWDVVREPEGVGSKGYLAWLIPEADARLIALAPDLARLCAEQADVISRFSEWDMLWVHPDGKGVTADAPYWQSEIAKVQAKLRELEVRT